MSQLTRAIILFEGRCGSSHLTELIAQHPSAAFFGEILSGLSADGWARQKQWINQTFSMTAHEGKALTLVGFKTKLRAVSPEHQQEFMELLIKYDVRIIRMFRNNLLKQAISSCRADRLVVQHGLYNVPASKPDIKIGPIAIGLGELRDKLTYFTTEEPRIDDFILRLPTTMPKMLLSYEELLNSRTSTMRRVYDFLNLECHEAQDIYLKNTDDDLRNVVSNYAELEQALSATIYSTMIAEDTNKLQDGSAPGSQTNMFFQHFKAALLNREAQHENYDHLREQIVQIITSEEFCLRNSPVISSEMQPNFLLPERVPESEHLSWRPCDYTDYLRDEYANALKMLKIPFGIFRKYWDYAFIVNTLMEKGKLGEGRRGLGIGVGKERLPAFFAGVGCDIVATDKRNGIEGNWAASNQHTGSKRDLFFAELIDEAVFEKRVEFAHINADELEELGDSQFDFIWSASVIEHLGGMQAIKDLLEVNYRILRPGGVFVHTTEINLSSNEKTVSAAACYIPRRRDLEELRDFCLRVGFHCPGIYVTPTSHSKNFSIISPPSVRKAWGAILHTSFGLWGARPS